MVNMVYRLLTSLHVYKMDNRDSGQPNAQFVRVFVFSHLDS